jgi:peptidyl-prolyl cis-trans isomerase D
MLRGIRKASENWLGRIVMAVVMLVLTGSFAVWGINDIFRGFSRSSLAKIGDTEISIDQFRQIYQERLQQISRQVGRPLPPDQASALGIDKQVLGEMIGQAGLDQRSRQMGLSLSTDEIARHITTDPQLQTPEGKFDKAKFDAILRNMSTTEQRFIADRRQQTLRRQILDSVAGAVTPPKTWLDALNQFQNEQRGIQYLSLGPAQAGDVPQPTAEELHKYFDERRIVFRAPEYRKIETVTVTPAELSKWMELSDDDIKKAYDEHRAAFTTPERRHIEQMVFPNMADAQAAADRIKSGTSFVDVATERGLKPQDIDLGTVTKSQLVEPAVADAAFALKEGEVSAPVQVQFGAVLATVLKIDPEVTKPFAEAAPQIRTTLAMERARQQVGDLHDKIEDERAGGATLEEAAAKLKLPVVTYDVDRSGHDSDNKPVAANLAQGPRVVNAAFTSDVGVDNDPIDADGGYVWYDVASIAPARDRTLDEVKTEVETRWRNDEIASRLKAKAADLLDKLKNGGTLDALATANGVKVETTNDLKRARTTNDIAATMTAAIFHTAKDAYGSAAGDNPTQWIVFRVTDVKTPLLDPNSPDGKQIAQRLNQQMSDDLTNQYVGWLEDYLGTTINTAELSQALSNGAPDTN